MFSNQQQEIVELVPNSYRVGWGREHQEEVVIPTISHFPFFVVFREQSDELWSLLYIYLSESKTVLGQAVFMGICGICGNFMGTPARPLQTRKQLLTMNSSIFLRRVTTRAGAGVAEQRRCLNGKFLACFSTGKRKKGQTSPLERRKR